MKIHILVTYLLVFHVISLDFNLDRNTKNMKLNTKSKQNNGLDANYVNQGNPSYQNILTSGNPNMAPSPEPNIQGPNQLGSGLGINNQQSAPNTQTGSGINSPGNQGPNQLGLGINNQPLGPNSSGNQGSNTQSGSVPNIQPLGQNTPGSQGLNIPNLTTTPGSQGNFATANNSNNNLFKNCSQDVIQTCIQYCKSLNKSLKECKVTNESEKRDANQTQLIKENICQCVEELTSGNNAASFNAQPQNSQQQNNPQQLNNQPNSLKNYLQQPNQQNPLQSNLQPPTTQVNASKVTKKRRNNRKN